MTTQSSSSFFSSFPDFTPNPNSPISTDFQRLANLRGWKTNSKHWRKMWNKCMNLEYDRLIGKTLTSLQSWQRLCEEVGLGDGGQFESIKKCKSALQNVYVNIVDLLDARRTGKKVKTFKNIWKLSSYTKKNGKVFSRVLAKQDKLLRVLLRVLV